MGKHRTDMACTCPDDCRCRRLFEQGPPCGCRQHALSVAEREAARRARREAKADRLTGWAESRQRRADADLGRARQMVDAIPFGQPILVGHHSERRDRNYRDRAWATMGRGVEHAKVAERHAGRAERIRAWEEERLSAPVTLRRIATLEAEGRDIERKLTPCRTSGRRMKAEAEGREFTCPVCFAVLTVTDRATPEHGSAATVNAAWAERMAGRAAEIAEEVAYWRAHLAQLEAAGVKLWGPDDFAKGDRVVCNGHPGTVRRVNAKSITVEFDVMPGMARPVGYDKVNRKEA